MFVLFIFFRISCITAWK